MADERWARLKDAFEALVELSRDKQRERVAVLAATDPELSRRLASGAAALLRAKGERPEWLRGPPANSLAHAADGFEIAHMVWFGYARSHRYRMPEVFMLHGKKVVLVAFAATLTAAAPASAQYGTFDLGEHCLPDPVVGCSVFRVNHSPGLLDLWVRNSTPRLPITRPVGYDDLTIETHGSWLYFLEVAVPGLVRVEALRASTIGENVDAHVRGYFHPGYGDPEDARIWNLQGGWDFVSYPGIFLLAAAGADVPYISGCENAGRPPLQYVTCDDEWVRFMLYYVGNAIPAQIGIYKGYEGGRIWSDGWGAERVGECYFGPQHERFRGLERCVPATLQTTVPEPVTLALLATGLALLGLATRRRRMR